MIESFQLDPTYFYQPLLKIDKNMIHLWICQPTLNTTKADNIATLLYYKIKLNNNQ